MTFLSYMNVLRCMFHYVPPNKFFTKLIAEFVNIKLPAILIKISITTRLLFKAAHIVQKTVLLIE